MRKREKFSVREGKLSYITNREWSFRGIVINVGGGREEIYFIGNNRKGKIFY